MHHLDPHARPPEGIRKVYKKYQKMSPEQLNQDTDILDLSSPAAALLNKKVRLVRQYAKEELTATFRTFAGDEDTVTQEEDLDLSSSSIPVYEHEDMPGLHLLPTLLPPDTQTHLLSRLLHRHLSSPHHLTNIHTHYALDYPPSSSSFFTIPPSSSHPIATPLNPTIHKPLSIAQVLNRKLRWTTLGGQYDWTAKKYPDTVPPPPFPPDVKGMLESVFPGTKAEAAIVNLYTPGDTLSVHRDVAEASGRGLVSVSLGCDAVFVIGTGAGTGGDGGGGGEEEKVLTLRLRSGSAVYMSGASRFAWHGVPQIVVGTCPDYLKDWPGDAHGDGTGEYEQWRGWMANKRVNLNVRQMWD